MTRPTTAAKGQPYPARHRHRVKITAPEICDSLHSDHELAGIMEFGPVARRQYLFAMNSSWAGNLVRISVP